MENIYVSPTGNDNLSGTYEEPFRTISRAQKYAREKKDKVIVNLFDGYYFIHETIRFDERDNGTVYKAIDGAIPTISGGIKVENWEKCSENIWRAYVSMPSVIRELYVNGRPAKRAASKTLIKPLGWYNDLSNLDTEVDGIFVDSSEVKLCENAEEIQIHYCRGWRSMTVNIEGIIPYDEKRNILVSRHPTFASVRGGLHKVTQSSPFILENAIQFMDSENDFYYNSKEKYIYYFTNQDMTKSEVYVPVLEELVSICGSDLNNKAKNITLDGITFAHTAWFRPHKHGLLVVQANSINILDSRSHEILNNSFVPAAVRVSAAERVCIKNSVFTDMGAVAIGFYEGVNKSSIENNVFYDISDSAMTIGLPHHNFEEPILCGYNHARGKYAHASEEYGGNEAIRAISGDLTKGWFTDMPDPWWEVDLGKDTLFDRIEIVSRLDEDQWDSRHSFSVLASTSNEPDNYTVLFTAGNKEAFDYRSTLVIAFEKHKKYRYIRVKRDIQHYFYINEVRVIDTDINYVPFKETCKDNLIKNNAITRIGQYNYAAPAIAAYYTEGLEVTHNTIWNVPYSGISIGWGWSMYTNSVTCRRNHVTYNEVYKHLNKCFDGGAVYTLGNQPGSSIKGNYFHDQPNYPGVIYMDEGTEGYTITQNVVENGDVAFFIHLPTSKYIKAYDNFSTSPNYSNQGEKCEITDTTLFIPGFYPKKAFDIISNAGVTDKDLINKIPRSAIKLEEIDKYINIINETTNVPEPVFITQYLKKCVFELESIIELVKSSNELSKTTTEQLEMLHKKACEFVSKPYENRKQVIEFRIYLKKKIKAILNNKS